jgi:hypothetical protein
MIRKLRRGHPDYSMAMTALLSAVYCYNQADYEALLTALKAGTLLDKACTDEDIADLKESYVTMSSGSVTTSTCEKKFGLLNQ